MIAAFYKIIPNQMTKKIIKPKFVWVDEPDENRLALIGIMNDTNFLHGIKELVVAEKTDPDFIEYLDVDIIQVEKEITKLQILQKRLKEARG